MPTNDKHTIEFHNVLKTTPAWSTLTHIGYQHLEADETGPKVTYECRNCTCGSTLYHEITPLPQT